MAEMEPNVAQMKSEAVRVHNLMRFQKTTLTKYFNKCLILVERFKQEQNSASSPLLVQAATEVITFHERTTDQLGRLEGNMHKFLDLTMQTFEGDDESELDKKIDEISTQIEKYSQSVDDLKSKNIETFRQIQLTLHPLPPQQKNPQSRSNHVPRFPCQFVSNHAQSLNQLS